MADQGQNTDVILDLDGRLALLVFKAGRAAFANYIYIVFDTQSRDAVLVDPGWDGAVVLRVLSEHGLRLRAVVLTHCHADHINAVPHIARAAGCLVYVSAREHQALDIPQTQIRTLDGDYTFCAGAVQVLALETPGHTWGSITYAIGNRLFTGDTLFAEGCGLCAAPGGDPDDLFQSLQKLKSRVPGHARVYPAHRYRAPPGQRFDRLQSINMYLRLTDPEAFRAFCNRPTRSAKKPPLPGTVPVMTTIYDMTPIAAPATDLS